MNHGSLGNDGKISTKPYYVKLNIPQELSEAACEALRQARQTGKVRKGTNETTKAIERGVAKLVVLAEDVEPPEVVAHIPLLCEERNVPYVFVPTKAQMGPPLGMDVGAASSCLVEPGDGKEIVEQIIDALSKLNNQE